MRQGKEEARALVGTDAMDFMEGMRDGWNGLLPSVLPNLVSFNIIIKVTLDLAVNVQNDSFLMFEKVRRSGRRVL